MYSTIKQALRDRHYEEALKLVEKVLAADEESHVLEPLAELLKEFPKDFLTSSGFLFKRLAILGAYTTKLLTPQLRIELFRRKFAVELWEADYGLLANAVLDPASALKDFKPDLIYLCVGTEHLDFSSVEQEQARWSTLLQKAHDLTGADIVTNSFQEPPHRIFGHLELRYKQSKTNYVRTLNSLLIAHSPSFVHFVDINFLSAREGYFRFFDERLYDLCKFPVSQSCLKLYAESIASVCAAIYGKSRKCLILDLDNTIWGGTVADDGIEGIVVSPGHPVGEAYRRFQAYLCELKDRGILLAVCSKNDESLAKEPFVRHRDMLLKLEDISCFMANWESKDQNILSIAKKLNLGLDALVFVDDNPAERALVRKSLPEVAVLEMPQDTADFTRALSQSSYFETIAITREDLRRVTQYKQNAEREELQSSLVDYADYLKELRMFATIAPFDEVNLVRIAQLINKTNQFNVTTRRYSESDLRKMLADKDCITRFVRLRDRFGDYGIVSACIAYKQKNTLEIDSWLMSCRVLKRGVEDILLRNIVDFARSNGIESIRGKFIPTPKNGLVANLYRQLGFCSAGMDGAASLWELKLSSYSSINPSYISEETE